jgi:polyribonucleotide nucleotidyltransferase
MEELERERTIHSWTLSEEREILKKINKLNLQKRKVQEFEKYDQAIKEKKNTVSKLRNTLKEHRSNIQNLQKELSAVSTAVQLGCQVQDLLGTKLECPTDKIGSVIGKNGRHIQLLQQQNHVNVEIVKGKKSQHNNNKKDGKIHLIGTIDAIHAATHDIQKTIQRIETHIPVTPILHLYCTQAKITALADLRNRHPHVYIHPLLNNQKSSEPSLKVAGAREDIQALQTDIEQNWILVQETMEVTHRESGIIVGKNGTVITDLVERHQVAITVQKRSTEMEDEPTVENQNQLVILTGPLIHVAAVRNEIQELLATVRDVEVDIPVNRNVKSALLLHNGAGITALHKRVNLATKELTTNHPKQQSSSAEDDSKMIGGPSYVAVNLHDDNIRIRGKAKVIECAKSIVQEQVTNWESMIVSIQVDPIVIPVMIGKSGQGIQTLKGNTVSVNLEFDRSTGTITVAGLDHTEIQTVVAAVHAVQNENTVRRVKCDHASNFSTLFSQLVRSSILKKIKEQDVFIMADDDANEIILRGKPEHVTQAEELVKTFLDANYSEELTVTNEDLTALLSGGKNSKIVELAKSTGVSLNSDRDRQIIIARGEKVRVPVAIRKVREFLYGGQDVVVKKVPMENNEIMGVVIGKGGKTKDELQAKFSSISIIVHRNEAAMTLRGTEQEVKECHIEIMKRILNSVIVRTFDVTPQQIEELQRANFVRQVVQHVLAQISITVESGNVRIRGSTADVKYDASLLKEQLEGIYECRLHIPSYLFGKLADACSNAAHLDIIVKQSGAHLALDKSEEEVIISGDRKCVEGAKWPVYKFFEFLFGSKMGIVEFPAAVLPLVAKTEYLAEISAISETQIMLDRDSSLAVIFSTDQEKVSMAKDAIKARVEEAENLVYVLQLEENEDWLLSSIIGKKGAGIKQLRKETKCTIEIDSKKRSITVSAKNAEYVMKAKETLASIVEKARQECVFVPVPENDVKAFVGRGGTSIKEFCSKYDVDVQTTRSGISSVRITGSAENVASAVATLKEWLNHRAGAQKDAAIVETKKLRAHQIPALIGTKGSVIRSLEKEFGCKIDVDRTLATVKVSGGSSERRRALLEKINEIVNTAREAKNDNAEVPESNSMDSDASSLKNQDARLPKSRNVTRKLSPANKESPVTSFDEHCFPCLSSAESEDGTTVCAPTTVNRISWATVVHDPPVKKYEDDDQIVTKVSEQKNEVYFVGDIIENDATMDVKMNALEEQD